MITLPDKWKYAAKSSAVQENWYIRLYYDTESSYLGLSDRDTLISSVQYFGVVLDWGGISEDINLAESRASIQEVDISCANVLKYGKLSDELYGGTRKYINRKVEIYSGLNDNTDDMILIFKGRLIGLQADHQTVTLTLEGIDPTYNITIPQTISPAGNYAPVAYGDFVPDTVTNFNIGKYYYPMPYEKRTSAYLYAVATKSYSTDMSVYFYDKNIDKFLKLKDALSFTNSVGDVYCALFTSDMERDVRLRPTKVDSTNEWTDAENSFDANDDGTSNTTTYAKYPSTGSQSESGGSYTEKMLYAGEIQTPQGKFSNLSLAVYAEVDLDSTNESDDKVNVINRTYNVTHEIVERSDADGVGTSTITNYSYDHTSNYTSNSYQLPTLISIRGGFYSDPASAGMSGKTRVQDVYLDGTIENDFTNEPQASEEFLASLEYVYCGGDGLSKSYSGGSGTATLIHEIHRDLLARFTDFDFSDSSLENWSSLNTARSGWTCHWWQLEPRSLREILDKAQYEGCFIFKFSNSGDGGRYIWVKDSYSSGDVAHTLNEDDYSNIEIGMTEVDEIITKWRYNFQRHPAQNKYLQSASYTNSTARSDWFVSVVNENVVERNLEFVTGNVVYDSSAHSSPNDCIALYYDNILANPKIRIAAQLINFSRFDIEVGDIIQFNDSNIDPFGKSWSSLYFMVTATERRPGMLSIIAREV